MAGSFRPGIRTEIVFTLTVLMVATVALVGILFLKMEERNLLQQKVRSGKQMIAALQKFLQDLNPGELEISAGHIPPENLQRVVTLFAQSQVLSNFSVVNGDFQVLADSRPERVGAVLKDEGLEKALATEKILTHSPAGEDSFLLMKKAPLLLSAPLIIQGKKVGALRGELPLDDLRETHSRSQATVFLYIIFDAFLLVVVGSLLLSRVIVNPLKKLVQMSEKIAEGNLESMAGPAGRDEIGKLFSSFNHMASRLREDRVKMEEYIRSLEQVNRELRRAQNEVLRSEKLASIGRLAAGVAHEVGNPTGAIIGYLDLLVKGLPERDQKEILQRAENEAERIRRIVRELLDFARPSPEKEEEVDVNTVIQNAFSLLSHQKKIWENVQVSKEFQENLPKWRGDAHQLQQVMINLFLNAADAMSSGNFAALGRKRKLRVATRSLGEEEDQEFKDNLSRRRKEDSPGINYSLLRARGMPLEPLLPDEVLSIIRVDVEDSGPGIPKENISKIFDPFFSTKPPGEGTGLGLAICLRILESYGGRISVQSSEGEGAMFTLLLPIFYPQTKKKVMDEEGQ